jgi:hypothetical protein
MLAIQSDHYSILRSRDREHCFVVHLLVSHTSFLNRQDVMPEAA